VYRAKNFNVIVLSPLWNCQFVHENTEKRGRGGLHFYSHAQKTPFSGLNFYSHARKNPFSENSVSLTLKNFLGLFHSI
jgi:hypothetical protein